MATKRTMRRVPEDVAEATYIRDLISADVNAKAGELAAGGPDTQDKLYVLMEYKKRWGGIVSDLSAPDESDDGPLALPMAPPAIGAPNLGVHVPQSAVDSAAASAEAAMKPEGGRANRTERQKTA